MLWLSWPHRSQTTRPPVTGFTPYSTPAGAAPGVAGSGAGRSGLANGNPAATAAVSSERPSPSRSTPSGRVLIQPCNARHGTGTQSASSEAATARTAANSTSSSASVSACTVRYSPARNSLLSPRASPTASSAASAAAASTPGSASRPRSASARRADSSRASCRRSPAAATGPGMGWTWVATSTRPGQPVSGSVHPAQIWAG